MSPPNSLINYSSVKELLLEIFYNHYVTLIKMRASLDESQIHYFGSQLARNVW